MKCVLLKRRPIKPDPRRERIRGEHPLRPLDDLWGSSPCPKATLDDLDFERMAQFIRTARVVRQFPLPLGTPPSDLLEHMNLLDDGRLTNAAVLLFGKAPQRFVMSSEVRCAHFHGTEVAKPIPSYQVYKGTAFELVDQAVDFVLSKINRRIGTRTENARAPRTYEIPAEVVTEAIVNAVAHRDYTDNGSVQVMLFADRLEVRNPGRLPPPLTLEQLREAHRSVPGNPLLGEALYLTEYIERMGTGTLDMIRRCVAAGLAEPEFAVTDGFVTTIRRAPPQDHEAAGAEQRAKSPAPSRETGQADSRQSEVSSRTGVQAGVQVAEEGLSVQSVLDGKDAALLSACLQAEASSKALQTAGSYAGRTRSFERRLGRMLAEGLLAMTDPAKPRSPRQRYRLTDRGRSALEC